MIALGIFMTPLYIDFMGAEAYGLVSFLGVVLALFGFLDMGMGSVIVGETSKFIIGAINRTYYLNLYRNIQLFFWITATIGSTVFYYSSDFLARNWFSASSLSVEILELSLKLIGIIAAIRWATVFYRSVLMGGEYFVKISYCNIIIATLRFITVFPVMSVYGFNVNVFFIYQVFVSCLELFLFILNVRKFIPGIKSKPVRSLNVFIFKKIFKFSIMLAVTSAVWILITTLDKLTLSKIISLHNYGLFSAILIVVSGIILITNPVMSIIIPRLTAEYAKGSKEQFLVSYLKYTNLLFTLTVPSFMIMFFFPRDLILLWSGNVELAEYGVNLMKLYAVGNISAAFAVLPYCIQYSIGNMKVHLIGNIILLALYAPLITFMAFNYNELGVAWVWAIINICYLIIISYIVHKKYLFSIRFKWILKYIALPFFIITVASLLIKYFTNLSGDRINIFINFALIYSVITALIISINNRFIFRGVVIEKNI